MNPYIPPVIDRISDSRGQSLLVCATVVLVWCSAIATMTSYWGARGFGFSLFAVACSWFVISRTTGKSLWPLNHVKPTLVECLVVLAICGVLHGLALPAVTTNCVGRRQLTTQSAANVCQFESLRGITSAMSSD
ncbi:MAG: hypothetical protein KDB03_06370 [Planctomycetales bacterium]|nr:hypothetical protein [Planctomycetales bacterium]